MIRHLLIAVACIISTQACASHQSSKSRCITPPVPSLISPKLKNYMTERELAENLFIQNKTNKVTNSTTLKVDKEVPVAVQQFTAIYMLQQANSPIEEEAEADSESDSMFIASYDEEVMNEIEF